jgi:hypothetical protein
MRRMILYLIDTKNHNNTRKQNVNMCIINYVTNKER